MDETLALLLKIQANEGHMASDDMTRDEEALAADLLDQGLLSWKGGTWGDTDWFYMTDKGLEAISKSQQP